MTGPRGAPYFGVLEEKAMNGMKGRQCLEEKKWYCRVPKPGSRVSRRKDDRLSKRNVKKNEGSKKCPDFVSEE